MEHQNKGVPEDESVDAESDSDESFNADEDYDSDESFDPERGYDSDSSFDAERDPDESLDPDKSSDAEKLYFSDELKKNLEFTKRILCLPQVELIPLKIFIKKEALEVWMTTIILILARLSEYNEGSSKTDLLKILKYVKTLLQELSMIENGQSEHLIFRKIKRKPVSDLIAKIVRELKTVQAKIESTMPQTTLLEV